MIYEWDKIKNDGNFLKHGMSMDAVYGFDWSTSTESIDRRRDYGEKRLVALGYIGYRLHVLTYTRRGEAVRVISLRKANDREEKIYENAKKTRLD